MKEILFGKTEEEIKELVKRMNFPAFTAGQILGWLYKKNISSIDDMSNLSKAFREKLKENYELGLSPPVKVQSSVDGTKKYLYSTLKGQFIESAFIPEKARATICISTQVGCKMACAFCMTGRQGFNGNLSPGEIINQIHSLPEKEKLTNIVYMGMGEPFDNLTNVLKSLDILTSSWGYAMSPKRITVSTIGIIPGIIEFLNKSQSHLAVSLHTPFEEERKKLMPIEHAHPLPEVLKTIKSFEFGKQRRISFEYIMFKGFNDTLHHVNELVRILHGLKARINLIRFHPIPGTSLEGSDDSSINYFAKSLTEKGIRTTVRASRGEDIFAACGLLSTKELNKTIYNQ